MCYCVFSAMKLFGSKKALMKERIRQKNAGHWIIHPCSNFRYVNSIYELSTLAFNMCLAFVLQQRAFSSCEIILMVKHNTYICIRAYILLCILLERTSNSHFKCHIVMNAESSSKGVELHICTHLDHRFA